VKSWTRIRIRIAIKTQKLEKLKMKMKPRRALDAHTGGVEAKNGADRHHFDEEQVSDPH
jgi:hypothetical protein